MVGATPAVVVGASSAAAAYMDRLLAGGVMMMTAKQEKQPGVLLSHKLLSQKLKLSWRRDGVFFHSSGRRDGVHGQGQV